MIKKCTKCNIEKDISDFNKQKNGKDGIRSYCKECAKKESHDWFLNNKDKALKNKQNYKRKNKDKLRFKAKERLKNDINHKIKRNLRTRLYHSIKSNKNGSAIRDLGCSIEELRTYLESLFKPGMTWDNYGEWHIDHIIPLCSFDLTNEEQLRAACHYTNLQPLWAKENASKGSEDKKYKTITESI